LSYLWLNTTPPALIFEEMSKAYANGMRNLWILNVGDLKPAEIGIEFFMQMAYDANRWNLTNQDQFLPRWAAREFGERNADEIAAIMDKYYRLGFQRKPEHLQWYIPGEVAKPSELTDDETKKRLDDYAYLRKQAEVIYNQIPANKKDAFYELVLYPVRSSSLANERFFTAEMARRHRSEGRADAKSWAARSVAADVEIASETKYFNEMVAGGKWRHIMSPEMNAGQWPSMRTTPPKISLADFDDLNEPAGAKTIAPAASPSEIISIEAEHFTDRNDKSRCGWMVIRGLGKTGDSVSVFPNTARSFANLLADSPSLEYKIIVKNSADFTADFYLVPTQPLVPGNGLRLAFSVDGGEPQIVTIDKDTEVSSRKWSLNILNESTVGTSKIHLEKGSHVLRLFAVDTGVVVDKIVLSSGELAPSYFGPTETISHLRKA